MPILVFLDLSVLDLGPIYATDRQTDVRCQTERQTSDSIIALCPRLLGAGIIIIILYSLLCQKAAQPLQIQHTINKTVKRRKKKRENN